LGQASLMDRLRRKQGQELPQGPLRKRPYSRGMELNGKIMGSGAGRSPKAPEMISKASKP